MPSEREIEDKAQEGVINGGKGAVREEMHFMGNGKAREELYSTSLITVIVVSIANATVLYC